MQKKKKLVKVNKSTDPQKKKKDPSSRSVDILIHGMHDSYIGHIKGVSCLFSHASRN